MKIVNGDTSRYTVQEKRINWDKSSFQRKRDTILMGLIRFVENNFDAHKTGGGTTRELMHHIHKAIDFKLDKKDEFNKKEMELMKEVADSGFDQR